MNSVAEKYRAVLKKYESNRHNGCPESAIVEDLMKAAVATNMVIQQVRQLEMDLMLQHEHLTNPYQLLAVFLFPMITERLTAILRAHAGKEGYTEKDVSVYLGDCIEYCFGRLWDYDGIMTCFKLFDYEYTGKEQIVNDFCKKWQVNLASRKEFEEYFQAIKRIVIYEVPIALEQKGTNEVRAHPRTRSSRFPQLDQGYAFYK